jgi:hypothetical protein
MAVAGQRVNVDHSSGSGGWTVFFYSAQNAQFVGSAFEQDCGGAKCISISSTAREDGQFVGGGTATDFTGTWYAIKQMLVPAGATDVSVRPTHLEPPEAADKDRVHAGIGGHDGKRDDQDPQALRR